MVAFLGNPRPTMIFSKVLNACKKRNQIKVKNKNVRLGTLPLSKTNMALNKIRKNHKIASEKNTWTKNLPWTSHLVLAGRPRWKSRVDGYNLRWHQSNSPQQRRRQLHRSYQWSYRWMGCQCREGAWPLYPSQLTLVDLCYKGLSIDTRRQSPQNNPQERRGWWLIPCTPHPGEKKRKLW